MTLGEKISKLRNDNNMSQGDLAEKINVSRQSISKWETGTSIPDLNKLIMISELFSVSIDELVKDGAVKEEAQKAEACLEDNKKPAERISGTQRILGFIFLAVGLLGAIVSLALNLITVILAAYLLLCGILCLTVKKHVGLIIGWLTFLPVAYFLPYFTSVSMGVIFNLYLYQSGLYIQLAIAYAMWIFMILLVFATVKKTFLRGNTFLIVGWVFFSQVYGYIPIAFGLRPYNGTIYLIQSWFVILLLAVLLFFTVKFILACVRKRKNIA